MNTTQAMAVLTFVSTVDGRNVDQDQASAWATTLPDVTAEEAIAVVPMFFREPERWLRRGERTWLMPDHVLKMVREARRTAQETRGQVEARQAMGMGRREPWRHCGNPACRCTHTHCGLGKKGYLDELHEYTGDGEHGLDGVTYQIMVRCPECYRWRFASKAEQDAEEGLL